MNPKAIAHIVELAGGEIVGRTRLQKVACLLEMAGENIGFHFDYHLYGPYSDDLAVAVTDAAALGLIQVEEKTAAWGGHYSIFRVPSVRSRNTAIAELAQRAAAAGSLELELAVTAAFLAKAGSKNPWDEVAARKSEKASGGRLEAAKALYAQLCKIKTPVKIPKI
jgi:uncharacterized protein